MVPTTTSGRSIRVMTELQWQVVVDAAEGAFSVELPAGWQHEVRMVRIGPEQRRIVSAQSPDGSVRVIGHDPDLPNFLEPGGMFPTSPMQRVSSYVTADVFLNDYLRARFADQPGYRFDGMKFEPEIVEQILRKGAEQGLNARATTMSARFGFQQPGPSGTPIAVEVLLMLSTVSMGLVWVPGVAAVFCSGADPQQYRSLLLRVTMSEQTSQQWRNAENQAFASQMQFNAQQDQLRLNQMTNLHNQRMGDIAASGAANTAIHNQRMATSEASTAAFLDRMSQPTASATEGPGLDQQHSWMNMIREEETVRTASGDDVQVDAGADRYFVDERNHTWVGAPDSADANDFRAAGLNPDDYQEGQVRR